MNTPTATYRIQFSPSFGFQAANSVISYLADLGISDLYASPIFKAVKGSLHGYDVVDPGRLNPELGGLSDFEALADELKKHNMGWIQDIVPNHMAMDSENRLLMDILENGYRSRYFPVFRRGLGPSGRQPQQENPRAVSWQVLRGVPRSRRDLHSNTGRTASRLRTTTSPSRCESNLISIFLKTWPI